MEKIVVEFLETHDGDQFCCCLCGDWAGVGDVAAWITSEKVDGGDWRGVGDMAAWITNEKVDGYVCGECLKDCANIDERMRKHVAWLRKERVEELREELRESIEHVQKCASLLEAAIGRVELPSYADWLAANKRYYEDFVIAEVNAFAEWEGISLDQAWEDRGLPDVRPVLAADARVADERGISIDQARGERLLEWARQEAE
jgi:hypothetical protein